MTASSIIEQLDIQPIVYHRPADFERYIFLSKTNLSLYLYTYKDGDIKEKECTNIWHQGDQGLPWVTPEAPTFSEPIYQNFTSYLSCWIQIYANRTWNKTPPSLGEVVRVVHTYCMGAGYQVFLVQEGLPLNMATPWEIDMSTMHEDWNYNV